MWLGQKGGASAEAASAAAGREAMFAELYKEVRNAGPSAQLNHGLKSRLEKMDPESRNVVCSMTKDGCSPLFVACKKGNVEIVEYLIKTCGANVEQRGLYEVPDDHNMTTLHNVTPLWCAAVAGKVKVVDTLVRCGADVNSVSDTGSTPVRSACFMTHLDIVKLLVGHRADIQRPNYNGGTCLINSVQSVELCEFLLRNGANVNAQDIQNKTALHYAIQERRFETTKLLLQFGADPFLESRYRDDAMQTACLKGAADIFTHLIDTVEYTAERVASGFELLGSTFLDEHHDSQKTMQYWRAAMDIREKYGVDKPQQQQQPLTGGPPRYAGQQREFRSRAELDSVSLDQDAMRTQALLVCERILGTAHKDTIYRLMYRGAAYADSLQYQRCIDLWKYALELRVNKDSILFCDTFFTAQALVKLYLDLFQKNAQGVLSTEVRVEDVLQTVELLARDLPRCAQLLTVAPQYKRQQDSYDKVLKVITHLLHLITRLPASQDIQLMTRQRIHNIVHSVDPRTTSGDSLLHLSVMKSNTLKSQNLFDDPAGHNYSFFPSADVARLLLECGAGVNAANCAASTPLHAASAPVNYRQEVVELLLAHGAHIDARNASSQRPSDMLRAIPGCKVNPLAHTTLRCLAAAAITMHSLPYKGEVPKMLEDFVEAH